MILFEVMYMVIVILSVFDSLIIGGYFDFGKAGASAYVK